MLDPLAPHERLCFMRFREAAAYSAGLFPPGFSESPTAFESHREGPLDRATVRLPSSGKGSRSARNGVNVVALDVIRRAKDASLFRSRLMP